MRLIDADALLKDITNRYCENCNRRKGIKNGVMKTLYEIGDAPCRSCAVDDMKDELENAPTVDADPVVRCKDCKYWDKTDIDDFGICKYWSGQTLVMQPTPTYHYCACGKSKDEKGE